MENKDLIKIAIEARENSYSPYSNFKVGAALLCKGGKVYKGTNVENCGYGPSNCAERSAIFSAISNGERKFEAIAIVGDGNGICYPCGVCRQVMAEFFDKNTKIICAQDENVFEVHTISDLLPHAFSPKDLV